jgi:pSer/pThr/pTyr-binding forkhead associated (FHA) protein
MFQLLLYSHFVFSVSRKHAEIECTASSSAAFIVDSASKFGVYVAGARVEGRRVLHDGDIITIGQVSPSPASFRRFLNAVPQRSFTSRLRAQSFTLFDRKCLRNRLQSLSRRCVCV